MPCDSMVKAGQTAVQRKAEVKKAAGEISKLIAAGRVKVIVDKAQGAVTFNGIPEAVRDGLTDACIYQKLSSAAKMKVALAEQLAGRRVDRAVVASGRHSHDGGASWHPRG